MPICTDPLQEGWTIRCLSIPHEISRRAVPRERLGDLARDPLRGWVCRHAKRHTKPSSVAQNDKTIQNLECDRRQDKEVDRRDAVDVIAEKRPPALRRWPRVAAHVPSDRRLGDLEAELEQLTMNTRRAPQCVRTAHLANERSQLSRDLRSANTVAVRSLRRSPAKHIELLPQDQVFRFQRCSRLEARSQDTENQLEQIGHQDASLRRPLAASTPNRIFGTHRRTGLRFQCCPVCRVETIRNGRSSIMDHQTKGEAPFANLVKTQLDAQPAAREQSREFPNAGRKVLLFSDGRQKAARLARDIPREVEQDIFRQVLALAARRLIDAGREPKPVRDLYIAVLTVLRDFNLSIFDRNDAVQIEQEIEKLEKDHRDDTLADLLMDFHFNDSPPRYKIALLKQLCGRYYSLTGTSTGILIPARRPSQKLWQELSSLYPSLTQTDVEELNIAWIAEMADKYAFDRDLP